jgi:hypothetical protein
VTDPGPNMTTLEQLQARAAAASAAVADPVPLIELPHSGQVELLRGVEIGDGKYDRTATVRELTGADEEAIAKYNLSKGSTSEFISLILSKAVVTLGMYDVSKQPQLLESLIVGDRDILFLAVIKATYGDSKTFDLQCPVCSEPNTVRLDIDEDFKLKDSDIDPTKPTFDVALRDGRVVTMKLPTGIEQKLVARAKPETISEGNTKMLGLCVVSVDGVNVVDKNKWALSLGMLDRRNIVNALTSAPGPSIEEVTVPCASCEQPLAVPMDWAALLWG